MIRNCSRREFLASAALAGLAPAQAAKGDERSQVSAETEPSISYPSPATARLLRLLRIDRPIVQAPAGGVVSSDMAAAVSNNGGLVTPVIIEWTYADGTKEIEKLPAEIWRMNEKQFSKVFKKDKEVTNIVIDPNLETADVNTEDNVFPKKEAASKFEQFKSENEK